MNKLKIISALLVLISLIINSYGQDVIVRQNGEYLNCKVIKTDSINVHFKISSTKNDIETYIPLSKVQQIYYENEANENQEIRDSIICKKVSNTNYYYYRGKLISRNKLKECLKSNTYSADLYFEYKNTKVAAILFSGLGGFMIGYSIGTYLGGGVPNWLLAGAGGGLVLISIPLQINSNKNLNKSIDIYNSTLNNSSSNQSKILLGMNSFGYGLTIVF